jgi:cyclopropane fatty-acyl-phospholipid synthase-like methyltransferase
MRPRQILPQAPEIEQLNEVESMFQDWRIYQKAEENNYLCHREVYALLHRFLLAHVSRPFVLLDLGCGDARFILKALAGTPIRHYVGVDLGKPALELALENLTCLACDHRLVEQDFFEFVRDAGVRADVIWMGLAFHHLPLPQKTAFLHLARQILPADGFLLMYEPMLLEDETREQFLERSWLNLNRAWQLMSREELHKIQAHVAQCDFPEKFSLLYRLGQEQGFSGADLLFQGPARLFSLICFRA